MNTSPGKKRLMGMNTFAPTVVAPDRSKIVEDLASQNRVRNLARFLGFDAQVVAEGLVEAVQRDVLRECETLRMTA